MPAAAEGQNPIADTRAETANLDYLALGDWHGTLEVAPRTWYAGAPEPDRFRANEPGNIFYILHRSKSDPQVYKILEQYHCAADLDAHGKSAHFQEANKVLATLVAAAPQIEVLDTV